MGGLPTAPESGRLSEGEPDTSIRHNHKQSFFMDLHMEWQDLAIANCLFLLELYSGFSQLVDTYSDWLIPVNM
jgi:hypothetical protein